MEKFTYIDVTRTDSLPKSPGVYSFWNKKELLYIGKAINLRDRVKNHFQRSSYRDNLFIDQVTRIGYKKTESEIDALLLESQLIKKHQPKYNVMWKDDKRYFYVAITKEPLPIVFLTHQPALVSRSPYLVSSMRNKKIQNTRYKIQDAQYIGPFVEGKAIKEVLRLLRRSFPYYTLRLRSGQAHGPKFCPWCHLNLCPGPNPNKKEYQKNIRKLAAVLQGKRLSVLKSIKKEMGQAASEQNFEKAGELRNQLFALENITLHSQNKNDLQKTLQGIFKTKKELQRIEAYDISNMQGKEATGSMVTFIDGKPAKQWYRKFKMHISGTPNDFAMLEETISRRLNHPEWPYPDLMIIDGGKGQLSAALKALGKYKIQNTKYKIQAAAIAKQHNELFLPNKKEPVLLKNLPQSVQNLILHIRDEAHRFAITYHKLLREKKFFPSKK